MLASGHYAAVLEIAPNLGIAVGTDGVGSKLIVAEQTGRYDTVGIDCVAMNVNDIICVGAEPLALLDYLAVEQVEPAVMEAIGIGLKAGAEAAGVEIPGGEVAVLPDLIRGHPSPHGFDLTAACFGTVALDRLVTGATCEPGDALIGLPSAGLHSNGYSLARATLEPLSYDARPAELGGASVADVLLEPTVIYVRAVLELLRSDIDVRGLAHITGGGVLNLLRLFADIGFEIDRPLPIPPRVRPDPGARRGARRRDVGGLQHGLRLLRRRARRGGGRRRGAARAPPPGHRAHRHRDGRDGPHQRPRARPDLLAVFVLDLGRALARGLGRRSTSSFVPAPGTEGSFFFFSQSSCAAWMLSSSLSCCFSMSASSYSSSAAFSSWPSINPPGRRRPPPHRAP